MKKLKNILKVIKGWRENLEGFKQVTGQAKKLSFGSSVKNKNIDCYSVGQGEKKIIFVGCMHGNEVGTAKLMNKLINFLSEQKSYSAFTFYIVPILNPDGLDVAAKNPDYAHGGRIGRFNANDVDLNRNFATQDWQKESDWSYGKNYSQKDKVFCGESAGSEPEVKSLCSFIKDNDVKVLFSFHNAGRDIMGNNNALSQELIKIYSEKTGFGLVSEGEWQKMTQTGTAKKWCDENNIVYVEVEGSNRWGSDWHRQKEAIISTIEFLKINKKIV
ncbi:MAG: M14 family zinc carboxypeptidase [Patescibacteria group bacterium]